MLVPGQQIGRYEILGLLGHGGMASVYRVRHTELGSEHALKLLDIHRERIRDRLLQEGRAQATVVHPNVVRVTDVLLHEGAPVLVMDLVDGPPLDRWLRDHGRPDLGTALALALGITRGLRAAHARGLVHRDLKPANVLLAPTPQGLLPKLVDFGLVKVVADDRRTQGALTRSGIAMGTPEFMSPEQIKDAAQVDHRADLYSLGCLIYLLVCGQLPFHGQNVVDLYRRIVAGIYPPPRQLVPGLPAPLEALITGLLQGDPEARPQSCDAVLSLLERPGARLPSGPSSLRPPDLLQAAASAGDAWQEVYGTHPLDRIRTRPPPRRVALRALPLVLPALAASLGILTAVRAPEVAGPSGEAASLAEVGVGAVPVEVPDVAPVVVPPPPDPEPEPPPPPRAEPPPPPAPTPPPRAEVVADGDASRVWLVRAGRRYQLPNDVPPGKYDVVALFPGTEPVTAGTVDVSEQALTLRCSAFAQRCVPRP